MRTYMPMVHERMCSTLLDGEDSAPGHIYVYIYMYVYMYVCMYIHTHTHTHSCIHVQMFELFTQMKERATLDGDVALGNVVDDCIALWTKMAISESEHSKQIESNVRKMQVECQQMLERLKTQVTDLDPQCRRLSLDELSSTLKSKGGGSGGGNLGSSGQQGSSGQLYGSQGSRGGGGYGADGMSGEMAGIGLILKYCSGEFVHWFTCAFMYVCVCICLHARAYGCMHSASTSQRAHPHNSYVCVCIHICSYTPTHTLMHAYLHFRLQKDTQTRTKIHKN
jgi:hypothetical protein